MNVLDGFDVEERELPKLHAMSDVHQVKAKEISTAAVAEAMSDDHHDACSVAVGTSNICSNIPMQATGTNPGSFYSKPRFRLWTGVRRAWETLCRVRVIERPKSL